MKLKPRALSLNNVVSYTMDLRDGDELLEIIDGAADHFRVVLVSKGYYTTGPVVFRALPDSREFTIMTTLGNQVNFAEDTHTGFQFQEHLEVETDYFYRHVDIDEPVPYEEIHRAVSDEGSTVRDIYHVILEFYGEVMLDLYVETENR